jgi:hypothetical protein
MARYQSVAEQFRIAREGTLAQLQKVLVATAKREHGRVMATDPKPSTFQRFVDGHQGATEESVKPDGVIVYRYPRIEQVVQFAMEALFDLSPVLSGEYRSAHEVFVDGKPSASLKGWQSGQEVVIANRMPYARKIEVGKMTMRVPGTDLVYQQARRKVMARWGNVARIEFTYRAILGGEQVNQARAASSGQPWWLGDGSARAASGVNESRLAKIHGKTAHNRSSLRYPCLVIREL